MRLTISILGHAAKDQPKKDVKNGVADGFTPKELWETSSVYQEFLLEIFARRLYKDRSNAKAGVAWQLKRNKKASMLREIETKANKDSWFIQHV